MFKWTDGVTLGKELERKLNEPLQWLHSLGLNYTKPLTTENYLKVVVNNYSLTEIGRSLE